MTLVAETGLCDDASGGGDISSGVGVSSGDVGGGDISSGDISNYDVSRISSA